MFTQVSVILSTVARSLPSWRSSGRQIPPTLEEDPPQDPPPTSRRKAEDGNTVNAGSVRILLEYILVLSLFPLRLCILFNCVLFSKAKHQIFAEKMRADKEIVARQKELERERVLKLEGDLKLSNREVQNLKEDKVHNIS